MTCAMPYTLAVEAYHETATSGGSDKQIATNVLLSLKTSGCNVLQDIFALCAQRIGLQFHTIHSVASGTSAAVGRSG